MRRLFARTGHRPRQRDDFDYRERGAQTEEQAKLSSDSATPGRDPCTCRLDEGTQVAKPTGGFLFHPSKAVTGRQAAKTQQARAGAYTFDAVVHAWAKALGQARRDGLDIPEKFTARRLRSTFVTATRKAGVDFHVLQAYIGHKQTTIRTEHYDEIDIERMRPIAARAQELFEGVGVFKEDGTRQAPEPMQR